MNLLVILFHYINKYIVLTARLLIKFKVKLYFEIIKTVSYLLS